jgi:putative ABC transport system permease protein
MTSLLQDLRYALRSLRKNRGFSAVAILTLALGIGAATAIYSVVDAVLLRPLPYPEPDRIVQLWQVTEEGEQSGVSDPNFADWAQQSRSLQAVAQFQARTTTVVGASEPLRSMSAQVSRDFFAVMGVQPVLGRAFLPEEQREGGAAAVVVSHEFWQRYLEGRTDLANLNLTFWDRSYAVVGVMPPGFDFPFGAALWSPRELRPLLPSRTALNWQVVGRLHDGVTLRHAQQELSAVTRQMRAQHGEIQWLADAAVVPLHEQLVGRVRPVLLVLLGAAVFLLLIAGVNVVNLLLARMATRRRELAVRAALGASRWRLVQQMLAESLVLAFLGGVLGVLLAGWAVRALLSVEPGNLPRADGIGLNPGVLAFTFGITLLTAAALSLVGAARASSADVRGDIAVSQRSQTGAGSPRGVQGVLVAAQIALTLVLLVGAGLLGRTMLRLLAVDPGFHTAGTVAMSISVPGAEDEPVRVAAFHDQLLARLRQLPGVQAAGGVNNLPLAGSGPSGTFLIQNHPDEIRSFEDFEALGGVAERTGYAAFRAASDGYFDAMGIPLVRGRGFDERDTYNATHVALISESLARSRWPGEDPLGKLIQFGNMDGDLRPMTVVGVVGDVREQALDAEPQPTVYATYRQRPVQASDFTFVMHGPAEAATMIASARRVLGEVAPEIAPRFRTIEEVIARPLAPRRFSLLLLGVFGITALLLATMGIYGVTAYSVAQRTHEIGIRMALGAQQSTVLRLVVRQGAVLALLGVVLGLVAAVGLSRLLTHLLYGVSTTDPGTFLGAAAFLVLIAVLASYVPARRAARVDPMIALRSE